MSSKPPSTPPPEKHILIVEDEVIVAQDLAFMVEDLGFGVLGPCHSLRAALSAMDERMPDFAILDVNLADGQIFPVADRLAASEVPFVFCSAHFEMGEVEARYPDAGLIQKPFSERSVLEAIETAGV